VYISYWSECALLNSSYDYTAWLPRNDQFSFTISRSPLDKKLILYVGVYRRIGLLIHHRSWHDYVKCDMINDQFGRCWITYFPSSEWYYLFNHLRLL